MTTVLQQILIFSGLCLVLSSAALFAAGARLRKTQRLTSSLWIAAISSAAWALQSRFLGADLSLPATMATALAAGALITVCYESRDVSGVTKVSSPGLSVGLAWRLRAPRLTFTVGPGFEQRWERRDKPDGTEIKNTQSGFTLSADVYFQANPLTSLSVITTYGDANQYRWSRGAIKRQITNQDFASNRSTSLGVELTEQGNDDVRRDEIGGLLELGFLGARASVQMRGGYSRSHNRDGSAETRPYFGVGIYRQL